MLPGLKKGLAGFLAVLLFLLPVNSFSLGLGEINLHSALNQPLDAEVALMSVGNTDPEEMVVKLASKETFDQAGIDRPFFLTKFRFNVAQRDNGDHYLKITSRDPVKEPFLDFIVEVNWPGGRVLREYTLLLDPPVLIDERSGALDIPLAEEAVPAATEGARTPQSTARAAATPAPAVRAAAPRFASRAGEVTRTESGEISYGPVQTSDTLWSIATAIRPDPSVTVQQVMIALLEENPEAFDNGNINDLKAGYFLRISDPAIISEISAAEAEQIAEAHYEAWVDAKQSAALAAGQRPLGVSGRGSAGEGGGAEPRLKLVAPDESGSMAGSGSTLGATSDDIREELAFALEAADISRQENEELRQRLAALEEQLASMQRLITLKDDTLSAMQVTPEELAAADEALEGTTLPDDAALEIAPSGEEEVVSAQGAQVEAAAEQPQVTPPPVMVPPTPPVETSVVDDIFGVVAGVLGGIDPMIALGGVAGVALLIGAVVMRRRKAAVAEDEGIDYSGAGDQSAAAEATLEESGEAVESVLSDAIPDYSATGGVDVSDEDEIDAIAEADVYLAYRRFDKAEELLSDAVQNDPDRHDLQVKLLEVYAASDRKDEFIERAEKLRSSLGGTDSAIWKSVAEMGAKIAPTSLLFTEDAADVDSTGASDELDVELPDLGSDLDLGDLDLDSDSEAAQPPAPESVSDNPFDDVSSDDLDLGDLDLGSSGDSLDLTDTTSSSGDPFDGLDDLGDLEASLDSALDMIADDTTDAASGLDVNRVATDSGSETAATESDNVPGDEFEFDATVEANADSAGDALDFSDITEEAAADVASVSSDEISAPAENDALDLSGSDLAIEDEGDAALSMESEEVVANTAHDLDEVATADQASAVAEVGSDDELALSDTVADTTTESAAADSVEDDLFAGLDDVAAGDEAAGGDDWLSELNSDISSLDDELGELDDSELFSAEDEVGTKLDLARAYIDMGDNESAKGILDEVVSDGNDVQKKDASELIERIS